MAKATRRRLGRVARLDENDARELRKHSKQEHHLRSLKADETDSWCTAPAGAQLGIGLGHRAEL